MFQSPAIVPVVGSWVSAVVGAGSLFSCPHAIAVAASSALSALAFLPDRVFCCDEACGLFIRGDCGGVHASIFFHHH